ncbi:MAG: MotA/TolQ/ExbB proton channel family protein [Syntrophotaleaceae bacterium]
MPAQDNIFNKMADGIITGLTYLINGYSGLLQLTVYFIMACVFAFALMKAYQSFRALSHFNFQNLKNRDGLNNLPASLKTPLAVISASFFHKAKQHYLDEKEKERNSDKVVPPDAFIRDAAYQFSERYFEEKFMEPISMMANLMPPMGFIGTIIGMVVHFLSNSGTLNSELTVAGIATALYTTFIGLVCFTFLEFLKKIFYSLAYKRIDEGLAAVADLGETANT